ncbi:MAG: hypothetical protein HC822_14875 [Oscillochloris sp.]|nr:hypothetical protein [Oscillochloris sp.]
MNHAIDNLRAAWYWAVDQQASGLFVQLAYSIGWFYEIQGRNRKFAQLVAGGAAALQAKAHQPAANTTAQIDILTTLAIESAATNPGVSVTALRYMADHHLARPLTRARYHSLRSTGVNHCTSRA